MGGGRIVPTLLYARQTQPRLMGALHRPTAGAMPGLLVPMEVRVRYASRASTRRWQDQQRVLNAKLAHILHLLEQLNRRHA